MICRLGADDLGSGIAAEVGLTEPGRQPQIVVPRYVDYFGQRRAEPEEDPEDDEFQVVVTVSGSRARSVETRRPSSPAPVVVADDQVSAVTVIQSSWRPARRWGVDWRRNTAVHVHIDGARPDAGAHPDAGGDYLYTPDYTHATPADAQDLTARINQLIAQDIHAIRRHHGID